MMNYESQEWLERLEQYNDGILKAADRALLEEKMATDPAFRTWVEQHKEFMELFHQYGTHAALKSTLDQAHEEIEPEVKELAVPPSAPANGRRLWPIISIAASVALVSVVGTLLIVRSFDIRHEAVYKELRRNVEQIKRSQRQILADITEQKKEKVKPEEYAGTGFLLTTNGYVVTNYHVIKDADSVFVENAKFGRMKSTIIRKDEENDVAILMIQNEDFSAGRSLPYTIRETEAEIGENVYTLGFPREDIVYGEGAISASTGYRQDQKAYQVSVPVNPGNSGGPLLDQNGNLTGMITAIQTETSGATFALKSGVLLDLVKQISADSLSKPFILPKCGRLKDAQRVDQVRKWKDYIFMVRVYNTR